MSRFVAAGVAFLALLWVTGWVVRPDMASRPEAYSEETLRAAEQLRRIDIKTGSR